MMFFGPGWGDGSGRRGCGLVFGFDGGPGDCGGCVGDCGRGVKWYGGWMV